MIYGFNVFFSRYACSIKLSYFLFKFYWFYQSFQVNSSIKKVSISIILATKSSNYQISYAYYMTIQWKKNYLSDFVKRYLVIELICIVASWILVLNYSYFGNETCFLFATYVLQGVSTLNPKSRDFPMQVCFVGLASLKPFILPQCRFNDHQLLLTCSKNNLAGHRSDMWPYSSLAFSVKGLLSFKEKQGNQRFISNVFISIL